MGLCSRLNSFPRRLHPHTLLELRFPSLLERPAYLKLRDCIRSLWFDYLIDAIVVANAVVAFVQVSSACAQGTPPWLSCTFSCADHVVRASV
jgi:hypothetical protein